MSCNLKEYKEFIDNEMLLILGQMDKATLIFDHVYLVRIFTSRYLCIILLHYFLRFSYMLTLKHCNTVDLSFLHTVKLACKPLAASVF